MPIPYVVHYWYGKTYIFINHLGKKSKRAGCWKNLQPKNHFAQEVKKSFVGCIQPKITVSCSSLYNMLYHCKGILLFCLSCRKKGKILLHITTVITCVRSSYSRLSNQQALLVIGTDVRAVCFTTNRHGWKPKSTGWDKAGAIKRQQAKGQKGIKFAKGVMF